MNVYDFAMKMEKEGEATYRDLAENAPNQGLKAIMTMLADAEVKHYHIIQSMSRQNGMPEVDEDRVLSEAKTIFQTMKEEGQTIDLAGTQKAAYEKALVVETKSRVFYEDQADDMDAGPQKNILLQLAEEEARHEVLLHNIIDFISRPERWLEDAEWNHLDEY